MSKKFDESFFDYASDQNDKEIDNLVKKHYTLRKWLQKLEFDWNSGEVRYFEDNKVLTLSDPIFDRKGDLPVIRAEDNNFVYITDRIFKDIIKLPKNYKRTVQ